jgi:hypothetical protein
MPIDSDRIFLRSRGPDRSSSEDRSMTENAVPLLDDTGPIAVRGRETTTSATSHTGRGARARTLPTCGRDATRSTRRTSASRSDASRQPGTGEVFVVGFKMG